MKKITKPSFEFIFSLSLIAILGLPPFVLGQNIKSIEIKINNGDTTFNGKDIKKLSGQERKEALAEIANLPQPPLYNNHSIITNRRIVIERDVTGNGKDNHVTIENNVDNNSAVIAGLEGRDSTNKDVRIRLKRLKGADSVQAFTYHFDNDLPPIALKKFNFDTPVHGRRLTSNSRNSQVFSYANTDADGISTNISFTVTDPSKENLKRIAGIDKTNLTINDLNLSPEFSTGKTILSFTLPSKAPADVKFTDTEGKVLWADKATAGNFSKKISLPVNGVYYLQIKQGAGIALKRIVKE
jgi:hypothetical protein